MVKYTRKSNSDYAQYRAQNPQSADFIAPSGKLANFMNPMDYLDPEMLQNGVQAVRGVAGHVGQGLQGLASGENQYLQGQLQGVKNLAGQVGQAVSPYLQQAQGYVQQVGQAASPYAQQAQQAFAPVGNAVGNAVGGGVQQAGAFLGRAAAGIDPVQAGELAAASTGAAAGGIGLGRLARARRLAQQGAGGVQQVPGMLQQGMQAVGNLPMGAKLGAGVAGAAGLAGGAYGINRMLQEDPNAQYSKQSIALAKFQQRRK